MDNICRKTLCALAKRNKLNMMRDGTGWMSHYPNGDLHSIELPVNKYCCLICSSIIWIYEMEEHSINHLKEKGLLAFL